MRLLLTQHWLAFAAWPFEVSFNYRRTGRWIPLLAQLPRRTSILQPLSGLRTCELATQIKFLESRQCVFEPFVDVRLQCLGSSVDVARKGSLKDLSMFLNRLFTAIRQNQHLVAEVFVIEHRV